MRWICDSCGVEWIEENGKEDGVEHRIPTCRACCPEIESAAFKEPEDEE